MGECSPGTAESLYAFYDLSLAPATFDFASFLFLAEMRRQELGARDIHPVIVPGPDGGFRQDQFRIYQQMGARDYDFDIMNWRLKNIIVPTVWLLPDSGGMTLALSRDEVRKRFAQLKGPVFPEGYGVENPVLGPYEVKDLQKYSQDKKSITSSVVPSSQALRYVDRWMAGNLGSRRLVVITLRECDYENHRNSRVREWVKFAAGLDKRYYLPVFVRDMDRVFSEPLAGCDGYEPLLFAEVVWNLELRAALYSRCFLHMSVANGPTNLSYFNRMSRVLVFYKPSAGGGAGYAYMASQGLPPGSQFNWFSPLQKLVWQEDSADNLRHEFESMAALIDSFQRMDMDKAGAGVEAALTNQAFLEAEWRVNLLLESFPDRQETWLLRSRVSRLAGFVERSLAAVKQAASLQENKQVLDELEQVALSLGKVEEAKSIGSYRESRFSQ